VIDNPLERPTWGLPKSSNQKHPQLGPSSWTAPSGNLGVLLGLNMITKIY
jgi:hypothetical protein